MNNYRATVTPALELSDQVRRQMQRLYFRYYDGSDEQTFQHDLESKTDAVLLHSGTKLAGFTMLHQYRHVLSSGPIQVIYSGDTVVDRPHWGQNALASQCIERMGQYSRLSDLPAYWFLLVKGHRTYRYLSAYCRSFYPHWSIDRGDLKPLADELALRKFGDVYNSDTGVVEFFPSKGHLNDCVAYPSERHLEKPEVRFFVERNPGYVHGHELVCISELSERNLKPLTRRLFRRGWRVR
jgi:hypothetical protein